MLPIDVDVRRFGPAPETLGGYPLAPAAPLDHASWFAAAGSGGVGVLQVEGTLHLAAGPQARGWRIVGDGVEPLAFDDAVPPEVDTEALRDRQLSDSLRWCSVPARRGEGYLLATGTVAVDPANVQGDRTLRDLPEPAAPGFFARLLGARAPEGLALVATVRGPEPAPPDGFLPWLRDHVDRGLNWHCWGTEGGGEMTLHDAPAPDDVAEALLAIARTHEDLDPDSFADLYANWGESGMTRATDLADLVDGQPERGSWRPVPVDDLAEVFRAYAFERGPDGLRHERTLAGEGFVARLRQALIEPVAIAVHAEPIDESVIVWFVVGGVSRTSGRLEVLLSERVWT